MKKYLISIFTVLALLVVLVVTDNHNTVTAYQSGAPAGYTGSPGDKFNCITCHSGTASSQSGLITSTIPLVGYTPGDTYTITASITTANVVKYGFEVSAQNVAGAKKGTLSVISSSQTQLVGSGKYITHRLAGTGATDGSRTWTFNWTAPIAGTGDVTFYGAFNSTNNDGGSNGDKITLSQMLVHESPTAAVHEPAAEQYVNVFPNPAASFVTITPLSASASLSLVSVYDLSGRKVMEEAFNSGPVTLNIQSLESGIYILNMNMGDKVLTEKIVVTN